jgi:hypothetical protein
MRNGVSELAIKGRTMENEGIEMRDGFLHVKKTASRGLQKGRSRRSLPLVG